MIHINCKDDKDNLETLSEYIKKYINKIFVEYAVEKYEGYVEDHLERLGMKGNIKTLKYVEDKLGD